MSAKHYLKGVNSLQDLQQRKRRLKKEVELSRERLSREFEEWLDLGSSKFKKGLAATAVTGLATAGIRHLLGGGRKEDSEVSQAGLFLSKAGGPLQKIRSWIPLLLPVFNAVAAFLRRRRDDIS